MDLLQEMFDLITAVGVEIDIETLNNNHDQINNLADYCRNNEIYKERKCLITGLTKELNAVDIYTSLITSLIESNNYEEMCFICILLIPLISDKLNEVNKVKIEWT